MIIATTCIIDSLLLHKGPPLDTSVSEISITVGKEIEIKFKITDNSPAPARGVMIAAKHLESGNVSFDRPIMGGPMEASYKLMKGLNEIAPDYYNFSITPYNTLGSGTAVSLKQFINGMQSFTMSTSNTYTLVNPVHQCRLELYSGDDHI